MGLKKGGSYVKVFYYGVFKRKKRYELVFSKEDVKNLPKDRFYESIGAIPIEPKEVHSIIPVILEEVSSRLKASVHLRIH